MLYFVSAELALTYWLFAFLSVLGVLQWVATRYRLGGLSFFECCWSATGYRPQSHRWGYAFATLCAVVGATGFFVTQWEAIFTPGPAGAELVVLFATSAACALAVTLAVAALLQHRRESWAWLRPGEGGQPVAVGHATGYVYAPAEPKGLVPAVCLLPAYCDRAAGRTGGAIGTVSPSAGREGIGQTGGVQSMTLLARRLAREGVVALLIQPDEQSYAYPAGLAILPAAVAVLSKRPEVDAARIGALGEDLGGDLVIRAASTSKEIRAVVALAPVLADVPVGLDLLREMSYLRAWRWSRDRKRAKLRQELNAAEYGARIPPRPFLLLYGEHDRLVGDPRQLLHLPAQEGAQHSSEGLPNDARDEDEIQVQVIPGAGHFHLAEHPAALEIISAWLKEHL